MAQNTGHLPLSDTMGDGIRKLMQRIIWNYDNDGTVNSKFRIRYDFNSQTYPNPPNTI